MIIRSVKFKSLKKREYLILKKIKTKKNLKNKRIN